MPGTTAFPDEELIVEDIGGGSGGPKPPPGGGDDDGDKRRRPEPGGRPSPNRYYTGIALGIVSILMFFMALASAFLLRRGTSGDWIPVHLPAVLWFNTIAILASSFTLERARGALSRLDLFGFRNLWTAPARGVAATRGSGRFHVQQSRQQFLLYFYRCPRRASPRRNWRTTLRSDSEVRQHDYCTAYGGGDRFLLLAFYGWTLDLPAGASLFGQVKF